MDKGVAKNSYGELVAKRVNETPIEVNMDKGKPSHAPAYELRWAMDTRPHLNTPSLIEGLLKPHSLIVTYGESNSGKTFHALDQDMCIASGVPWFDRETEQSTVIYVAAEGPHSVENRVFGYCCETGLDPSFALMPHPICLHGDNSDTLPLIDFIKATQDATGKDIGKVTIDTLARAMGAGNENASDDMGQLIHHADLIRTECGAAVHFIHHTGKDTARGARGHSSLRAATDTEIEVTGDNGTHIARVTKQRDWAVGDEFAFRLRVIELGRDKRGKPVTTCVPERITDYQATKVPSLTKQERSLVKIIRDLMKQHKKLAPADLTASAKNPPKPGQFVLSATLLRDHVEQVGGISDADKADSQKRAVRRCLQSLRDKGFIEVFEDYIWWADKADEGGQT